MANSMEEKVREFECNKETGRVTKESGDEVTQKEGDKIEDEHQHVTAESRDTKSKNLFFNELCSPSFLVQSRIDLQTLDQDSFKRRNYRKFSAEERWQIGMLASEMGTTKAIRQLENQCPEIKLAESTVRSFKNMYVRERKNKRSNLMIKVEKTVRGKYQTYSEKDRAVIGKYAFSNGNASAIRHFKDSYPKLSESTVRGFKNIYTKEVERRKDGENLENHVLEANDIPRTNSDCLDYTGKQEARPLQSQCPPMSDQLSIKSSAIEKAIEITSLPRRKRGRPGKIPSRIEAQLVTYLGAIAEKDINLLTHQAVIAITKGLIMVEDRLLLSEFGGGLIIDKGWAKSFMKRHKSCSLIPKTTSVREIDGLSFNSVLVEEDSDDGAVSDIEAERSFHSL